MAHLECFYWYKRSASVARINQFTAERKNDIDQNFKNENTVVILNFELLVKRKR